MPKKKKSHSKRHKNKKSKKQKLDSLGTSRRFIWTCNNPPEDYDWSVLSWAMGETLIKYIVFQEEVAPKTGTPHLQGYLELAEPRRQSWLKSNFILPKSRYAFAIKAPAANIKYCTKTDTRVLGPWELGESGGGQGYRSDLFEIGVRLMAGEPVKKIAMEQPQKFFMYGNMWAKFESLVYEPPIWEPQEVWLIIGPTDVGKTRFVFDRFADGEQEGCQVYRVPPGKGLWFNNYTNQETILFDDFSGAASDIKLVDFLQLLDGYPIQLPSKGGFTWRRCKRMCVTTNIHPKNWYRWDWRPQQYAALIRRFDHIRSWTAGAVAPGTDRCRRFDVGKPKPEVCEWDKKIYGY